MDFHDDGVTPRTIVTPWVEKANSTDDFVARLRDMGLEIPDGYKVVMRQASYDAAAWVRDAPFKPGTEPVDEGGDGTLQKMPATTRPLWRYRFELIPDTGADDLDLQQLTATITAARRATPRRASGVERHVVVAFGDPQAGKVDDGGDSSDLIARVDERFNRLEDYLVRLRRNGRGAQFGVFADAGDLIEGFSNTGSQAQSNDLSKTRQFRVGRRLIHAGIDSLARNVPEVTAITCGSNHCQERVGKDLARDPLDDWGIEAMSVVQDIMRISPAYAHVKFAFPQEWRDTVSVRLAGEQILGLGHGHQAGQSDRIVDWWAGQMGGGMPIADATVLLTGHFHYPRIEQPWSGKWWVQCSTLDNGSSWFGRSKGRTSDPGLTVFTVTADGLDLETYTVL